MTDETDPDSVYHLKNARDSLIAARDDIGVPLYAFQCRCDEDQRDPEWQALVVNLNNQRLTLACEVRDHIVKALAGIAALLKS